MKKENKKGIERCVEEIENYLDFIGDKAEEEDRDTRVFWIDMEIKSIRTYLHHIMNKLKNEKDE
jgi:hypothetical protein